MTAAFLVGGGFTLWGCTDESGPTDPLEDIAVSDGAVLIGRVTDTDGNFAEGAVLILEEMADGQSMTLIRALEDGSAFDRSAKSAGITTATTRDDGKFRFIDVAAGEYLLSSTLRDHQGSHEKSQARPMGSTAFRRATDGAAESDQHLWPAGHSF